MRNKELLKPLLIAFSASLILIIISFIFNLVAGIVALAMCIIINLVYIDVTVKRYNQIKVLNDYLNRVVSGDYLLDISDNVEGELSILKNNLYKVVVQLQTSNDLLEKDKKYLADSLADISHQLKTPLTSMMVMTDLIKEESDKQKSNEFVNIIEAQLDKMKWLIATLLKLSKLDAGTVDFIKTNLEISNIINESLKPFLLTLDLRNIKIEQNVTNFSFNGDLNWTVEAVENIIKNCIEHTADNGKLFIETSITNVYDELIIADNGCGIDNEDLPHIFDRFYHGKNASADSVGIGLALSKEILAKQKATIEVESKMDCGTRFSIKFYKTII